jgi:hypothetical protein
MSYTKRNTRVDTFVVATQFDDADTALAVNCSAQLRTRVANDQVPTEVADLPLKSVSFNLIATPVSTTNYTAAGKTVNGVQLAALIREATLAEATRQNV